MDILTPVAARPSGPPLPATPPAAAEPAKITSDFDTFLKLLTAQIRNQDPLEPADATAYTAQLATFSNVEQAVKTNDLLARMIASLDGQGVSGVAGYIGMDARHSGPVAHDGGQAILFPTIGAAADRAELVVSDASGREVARHPIDPRAPSLGWPARGQGDSVPSGQYLLRVESWAGDQALQTTKVAHYGRVEEVILGASGPELVLRGGVRLRADQFESIRAPSS